MAHPVSGAVRRALGLMLVFLLAASVCSFAPAQAAPPSSTPQSSKPPQEKRLPKPPPNQAAQRPKPGGRAARRPIPNLAVGLTSPTIDPHAVSVGLPPLPAIGGTWTALGPQPIGNERCCGATPGSAYGNAAGRIASLVTDLTNGNTVYAGTAGGGVWKSTNAGNTWSPLSDSQASLAIGALAIDASGLILYAGTGEDNGPSDAQFGQGILKSTDGGATWTLTGGSIFAGQHVGGLAVDNSNNQHVLAATDVGLFVTNDGGSTWSQNTQILTVTTSIPPPSGGIFQILQDPSTPGLFWAAVADFCNTEFGNILVSTDGGTTWSQVFDVLTDPSISITAASRIALGVGPGGVAYAAFAGCDGNIPLQGGIQKTTTGGSTWSSLSGSPGYFNYFNLTGGPRGQGSYDTMVGVDPTNSNNAVFGGVTILVTNDGGASFRNVGNVYGEASPPGGFIHPDFHAVAFTGARTFYVGNDGGVWQTTNLGGTGSSVDWTNLNATLNVTQFYTGTALDTTRLLGGAQDNGSPGNLPGAPPLPAWPEYHGGDGGYTAIDPTPASTTIYAEYPFLFIERGSSSIDPANPFSPYNSFQLAAPCSVGTDPACSDLAAGRVAFIAPFRMDRFNPQRLLGGTHRVWQSLSGGTPGTWTPISPDLTGGPGVGDYISVLVMGQQPGQTNIIFTGSDQGVVFMTTDGGSTWLNITGNLPAFSPSSYVFPNHWISGITFNPTNPQEAWATLGGINVPHVWHTVNAGAPGGTLWSPLDGSGPGGLGNVIVSSVVLDPRQPGVIYIGTYYGVAACAACGGPAPTPAWAPFGTGLPNVYVNDLSLTQDGTQVIAWTHGRGVWTTPI